MLHIDPEYKDAQKYKEQYKKDKDSMKYKLSLAYKSGKGWISKNEH